ncbi:TRAP transporter small permease subunit [Antarctobacter sp.]|uniref:TRAP transporter small permease subunit n=1 Tax=Antarctobacter sp. TaxID=1872577 RepID=UPI003A911D8B
MALLVYMVLHVSLEIVMRAFFATSTYSMDEYVGYAVGAMTFMALADTFRERKHIRVGLILARLRGRAAATVEVICILLTFGITVFLARFIWRMLARDFHRGSVSPTVNETPLWMIDAVIFAGLVLFMIQLIASLLDVLRNGQPLETAQGD